MPRFDLTLLTIGLAVVATLLWALAFIGVPALCWIYGLDAIACAGALMLADRDRGVRATGAAFLAVAVLGAGVALSIAPAHAAEGVAAPPGDTGLWSSINPYLADGLGTVITAAVGWAAVRFHAFTGVSITAQQEARVRETLLTGAYRMAHELEVRLDGEVTPAVRAKILAGMVEWAESRMPGPAGLLARLGLGQPVVTAMATKVLGQVLGELPVIGGVLGDTLGGKA